MQGKPFLETNSYEKTLFMSDAKFYLFRESLKGRRTAVLWMQYMDMIDILKTFIRAERSGNWELHLYSLQAMLPYFAASGHNHYTKSVYIYLQIMNKLDETNPEVYKRFQDGFHVIRRSNRYWAGLSTDLAIEQVLMRSVKTTGGLTRGRGLTEIQRLVWLMSMPMCAQVNEAMQTLTDVQYATSNQHVDTSPARQERDFKDVIEIMKYLHARNPFDNDLSLKSISSGVVADRNVNADTAKDVGEKILKSMKGEVVVKHTFKKKDQVVTLAQKAAVKISGTQSHVDPQLLFQRFVLVATGGRYDDPQDLFRYEMCSYPPSLFDETLLPRQANKPALADAIWDQVNKDCHDVSCPQGSEYVLDGGALIHRVPWSNGQTYVDVCNKYVQYVRSRYPGRVTIVFDGYDDNPSTKDCAHMRRNSSQGQMVTFKPDMEIKLKKDKFLSNPINKQLFINLLSSQLRDSGYNTLHASGDADLQIVTAAVTLSQSSPTILVGDDTDLLILLCYHAKDALHDIFFKPESKSGSKKSGRIWNIKKVRGSLGEAVCDNILFLHAILGCDTTSRVHGLGKGIALKRFQKDANFRQQARIFLDKETTKQEVISAGEKALLMLYNSKSENTLNALRYTRFCQKVSTGTSSLQPENLPPTSSASAFHSLRVYYQVQQWKGDVSLHPSEWGWKLTDGKLMPIKTDQPPAPKALLEIIRCNCKSNCATNRCNCKKYNLDCTAACGTCEGQSCENASRPVTD